LDTEQRIQAWLDGLKRVFQGKDQFLRQVLSCFLAEGHLLLEDLPGTGKTTLARTMASLIGDIRFRRIQFTPDLLPFDITGVEIWDSQKNLFEFRHGPVFTHILLADEINRTTPKVQSALLEAMAENQVTVTGTAFKLEAPFFVMATQNPVEMEGTYPLPAAQLDRFMMKLSPGYPEREQEYEVLRRDPTRKVLPNLQALMERKELLDWQQQVQNVHCEDSLIRISVDCAALTREHEEVELGVSTRGALMLIQAARAYAFVLGRNYVEDQDLADLVVPVYAHRMIMRRKTASAGQLVEEIMDEQIRRQTR